jgi:deoxyribodipyrimidine photo-lyase
MMINLFWFRRDLRLHDNHGLFRALDSGLPVRCLFIFDEDILEDLRFDGDHTVDRRLIFIHRQLVRLDEELRRYGSGLLTMHGKPIDVWKEIAGGGEINTVYTNHDYEPYAINRDRSVAALLADHGIGFQTFKDQVIFERDEVCKDDGLPYKVFTPYSRRWKGALENSGLPHYPSEDRLDRLAPVEGGDIITLRQIGFRDSDAGFPQDRVPDNLLAHYGEKRDFPAIDGTSRLGVHLRFGTVSIRSLARQAIRLKAETYLNELIWREFYQMILWHFPHVVERAFNPKYDHINWRNDKEEFDLWCEGMTGYPIVDAGMRELKATGYMHNRVRMITASFLTKHLLIDWRWGEALFARHLLDFELASNNGGWQWAAGTGCDAAPYFRVFNPEAQMKKFDRELNYVRQWVPEYGTEAYPRPMVEHKMARQRALDTYKKALA